MPTMFALGYLTIYALVFNPMVKRGSVIRELTPTWALRSPAVMAIMLANTICPETSCVFEEKIAVIVFYLIYCAHC